MARLVISCSGKEFGRRSVQCGVQLGEQSQRRGHCFRRGVEVALYSTERFLRRKGDKTSPPGPFCRAVRVNGGQQLERGQFHTVQCPASPFSST